MAEDSRINRRRLLQATGTLASGLFAAQLVVPTALAQTAGMQSNEQEQATVDWTAVANALGGPGQMKENGVFVVELSRSDLKVTRLGLTLQPDLVSDGEANFKQVAGGTMVMCELALLEKEVWPVYQALLASGFSVSAVHQHVTQISPLILFLHFSGMGDAVTMARNIRAALAHTGTPSTTTATKKQPKINIKGLQQVFGMPGEVGDEVFYFEVPRAEKITMNGMPVPASIGIESYLYFQGAGSAGAASQGEFALLASEIDMVAKTLAQHGIEVTALHNHMTTVHPMYFWMHTWASGDPITIAKGLHAALALTHSSM